MTPDKHSTSGKHEYKRTSRAAANLQQRITAIISLTVLITLIVIAAQYIK